MTIIQEGMFGYLASFCERCGRALYNPLSMQAHQGPVCRHKTGAKAMDEKKKIDMREWGTRFEYNTQTGPAHCYIKVRRCTVICTEAPDNPGMSITNAAEIVSRSVAYSYNIPLDRLVWIEHYVDISFEDSGQSFDLVKFDIDCDQFSNPAWSPLDKDSAMKMLESA